MLAIGGIPVNQFNIPITATKKEKDDYWYELLQVIGGASTTDMES
jgi:hypothetical protein